MKALPKNGSIWLPQKVNGDRLLLLPNEFLAICMHLTPTPTLKKPNYVRKIGNVSSKNHISIPIKKKKRKQCNVR